MTERTLGLHNLFVTFLQPNPISSLNPIFSFKLVDIPSYNSYNKIVIKVDSSIFDSRQSSYIRDGWFMNLSFYT